MPTFIDPDNHEDNGETAKQLILLTYEGPADFSTTEGMNDQGYFKTGAYALVEVMNEVEEICVAHIHSNNYLGAFADYKHVGDFVDYPIINPGSLNLAEYGKVSIVNSGGEDSFWYVNEMSKKFLMLDKNLLFNGIDDFSFEDFMEHVAVEHHYEDNEEEKDEDEDVKATHFKAPSHHHE